MEYSKRFNVKMHYNISAKEFCTRIHRFELFVLAILFQQSSVHLYSNFFLRSLACDDFKSWYVVDETQINNQF